VADQLWLMTCMREEEVVRKVNVTYSVMCWVTGRFATLPVCHLDVSLPPQTIRYMDGLLPGQFAIETF